MSENARIEQESFQRTTTSHRREYPGESSDDTLSDRRTYEDQGPPERGRYQGQNGRPPDRGNYQDRGYSGRDYTGRDGRPPGRGGPLEEEDPLIMEDPLMMENPLMIEDPLGMEDP